MKILITAPTFPVDSETFIINQAIGLKKSGCEVNVFSLNKKSNTIHKDRISKFSIMSNFKFLYSIDSHLMVAIFAVFAVLKLFFYPSHFKKVWGVLFGNELFIKQKLDIINYMVWNGNYIGCYDNILVHFGCHGAFILKMRDLGYLDGPISVIFHAYEISQYKRINRHFKEYLCLFNCAECLLPVSHFWRKLLLSWGAPAKRTSVHRMGVSLDDFSFVSNRSSCEYCLRVIQVGRLVEKKAVLDSIQAVISANEHIDIQFTVIGDGPLMPDALALIKHHAAEHYITMLGRKSQDDVQHYLEQADIFILPSVTATNGDMEGVPVALMEAMAMGLIVVSTQHSGIPELIDDGVSGFLANERSPAELCDILLKVQQLDSTRVNQIRQAARDKVAAEFSDVICYQQLIELTERLSAQYYHPN
jgi:colanic acid/amylovoran biosynthesis glycosyltransferase